MDDAPPDVAASRVAFVTGAASGLGFELCRVLLQRGYRVAMYSRDGAQLRVSELALAGGDRVITLAGDVTDAAAVRAAVATVISRWGGIDLAIANAGMRGATWADEFPLATAQRLMDTNYGGMLHLFDATLPSMLSRGSGRFAAIASLAGWRALPGGAGYGASKAAIRAFLDTMRVELEPRGVRISTIDPWFIRTAGKDDGLPRPMMVEPDWAAQRIVAAIEAGRRQFAFPWLAAWMWRAVRALPNAGFLWLFRPRRGRTSFGVKLLMMAGRGLGRGRERRRDDVS
jgi:NADP-dependent 3-hydroxy acid dehydrogenase YdfG